MTNKEFNNKIKVKALLETYSAKDICKIFTHIDKKIYSLHECSSDDFLQLNNEFKHLYKKSKTISDNVDEVIQLLHKDSNNKRFKIVNNYCENAIENIKLSDKNLIEITDFLKDLSNQLRFVFFPVKNYDQNLMSLKYLVANINLALPFLQDNKGLINNLKKIEENVYEIRSLIEKIPKIINTTRKISAIIASNYAPIEKAERDYETTLMDVIKKINSIENKYKSNETRIPDIQNITEKSAENISDIIKKLQYQDIIKQKMEHIQKTHKDLIKELGEFNYPSDDDRYINEKAKFFLRIRDIAGLQAAQLIQANKEYQTALEIIINNFLQIGDNMKIISQACAEFIDSNNNVNDEKLLAELNDSITYLDDTCQNRNIQYKKLIKEISSIVHHLNQSEKSFSFLDELNIELSVNLAAYYKEIERYSKQDSNIEKNLIQLKSLSKDIQQNGEKIIDFKEKIAPMQTRIKNYAGEKIDIFDKNDFKKIKISVDHLFELRSILEVKLKENQEISSGVINSIKKSISEIKYYDYFEKVIEEIITELNTINYNLKIDNEEIASKEENLRQLKNYYTMQTEHIIHDQVAEGKDVAIENEDNGEIEFF